MEIAKLPTPLLVKLALNIIPPLMSALAVGLICWGYFTWQNQKTSAEKISQTKISVENKFKAAREKDKNLIVSLQAKVDSASEATLLAKAEVERLKKELKDADAEIDQLSKELDDTHAQLSEKETELNTIIKSLKDLEATLSSESQEEDVQKEPASQEAASQEATE